MPFAELIAALCDELEIAPVVEDQRLDAAGAFGGLVAELVAELERELLRRAA